MVFSSLIFLFIFLPVVIIIPFFGGKKFRNLTLLFCSLFFYAWGEGLYVSVMLFSIVVNYFIGLLISAAKERRFSRIFLLLGVSTNLLVLFSFKYSNFIVDNINTLTPLFSLENINIPPIHLPIGISFFTFQAISYIVDIYRGKITVQRNIVNVGVYISMFPQLIAGPIVRFHDISKQLVDRVVRSEDMAIGIRRFVIGLGKKVLIANTVATVVDRIFLIPGAELPMLIAWLGAIGYAVQIFFDFSGYSDMAIGLGRIFGFRYLENFNYPYISSSMREFWRRWHISLASWFRDYLYFPLGGNRKGQIRTYFNLLTVFFLCGLWHGASWNFIIWGLIHGMFLVIERICLARFMAKWWRPFCHLYTLVIVVISWVFFRADNLPAAVDYLQSMLGVNPGDNLKHHLFIYFNLESGLALFFGFLFSTPIIVHLTTKMYQKIELFSDDGIYTSTCRMSFQFARLAVVFTIFGLSVISLAAGAYNPFIYFRF